MTTLNLFFDSRCPLCAAEMSRLAKLNRHNRLSFTDMHSPGFDAADYGTTYAAMDAELHGLTADGQMLIGIDCIVATYRAVGRGWLVWPLTVPATKPMWRRLYRWFARNRYSASRLMGMNCTDGVCDARYR